MSDAYDYPETTLETKYGTLRVAFTSAEHAHVETGPANVENPTYGLLTYRQNEYYGSFHVEKREEGGKVTWKMTHCYLSRPMLLKEPSSACKAAIEKAIMLAWNERVSKGDFDEAWREASIKHHTRELERWTGKREELQKEIKDAIAKCKEHDRAIRRLKTD